MSLNSPFLGKIANVIFGTPKKKEQVNRRRLRFESLENRELLSVSPLPMSSYYFTPSSCFELFDASTGQSIYAECEDGVHNTDSLIVFQVTNRTAAVVSYFGPSSSGDPAISIDSGAEYWDKTYSEGSWYEPWETWVWTIPDGVSIQDAERDFTFTGADCCDETLHLSVHICMTPEFISDVDEELSDPLPKNIDTYSHYILADAESGETTTGKVITADYLHDIGYSLVSQKDAYGNDVEIFDFDNGVITTAVSLAEEENLTDTYTLVVKASDSTHSDTGIISEDIATVTIHLLSIDLDTDSNNNGFTHSDIEDQYEMSVPGKIVYYNDDDDNNNEFPDRFDEEDSEQTHHDNELEQISISSHVVKGCTIEIEYDITKIKIWYSDDKTFGEIPSGASWQMMQNGTWNQNMFIEAVAYDNTNESTITVTLKNPEGNAVKTDSVKVTNAIFQMNHSTTNFHPAYQTIRKPNKTTCGTVI